MANQEIEDEDQVSHLFEENSIMMRLNGLQEPRATKAHLRRAKDGQRQGPNAGI